MPDTHEKPLNKIALLSSEKSRSMPCSWCGNEFTLTDNETKLLNTYFLAIRAFGKTQLLFQHYLKAITCCDACYYKLLDYTMDTKKILEKRKEK